MVHTVYEVGMRGARFLLLEITNDVELSISKSVVAWVVVGSELFVAIVFVELERALQLFFRQLRSVNSHTRSASARKNDILRA